MSGLSLILPNEKELFARTAKGDVAAFTEIFYHYTARIHPFIQKMTRSREVTEEIVQDVFVSIWNHKEKLNEIEHYAAYIFTIATNKTLNFKKSCAREKLRMKQHAINAVDYSNITTEQLDLRESQQMIAELVDQLPPQRKLIYRMSREQGLNHEQIAEQLQISPHTVKNQLVHALRFLRNNIHNQQGLSVTLISVLLKIQG